MRRQYIFDTSVWISFLNEIACPEANLLEESISSNDAIFLTPTILQEVLQGIRDDKRYEKIKNSLMYFDMIELDAVKAAIGAAQLYRTLRKKGITLRKSNDCLIAYYALSTNMSLVHAESDFDLIAEHNRLKTWKP